MDRPRCGIGVAAHEGQLFPLNQVVNIFTAIGLNIIDVSAVALWWRRRPQGLLGAPPPLAAAERRFSPWLLLPIAFLGILMPLLGISMALVALTERVVLRRIDAASRWLGLVSPAV